MAVEYVLWHYTPSLIAAMVMCSVFAIVTAGHLFFLIRTRARFCIPFVVGGIFEAVGYGARAVAHYHTKATMPYAIQSLLILLGPILFAASIYMILGRLIRSTKCEKHSLIPPKWMTKVFVGGDVTCFIIQGAGGGVMSGAKSQKTIDLGEDIILAGLCFQIVVFALFVVVAARFHLRARHNPVSAATQVPWQRYLFLLYLVSALVTARNIFRVVEYAWGSDGYLLRHEWTLYICDAMQMALVLIVCLTWYSCNFEVAPPAPLNERESKAAV
ncbi:RTM1 protein [Exophiala viscosa]|uniref:RTM1 protein n=1 Tax=Exophiala viscosa TaxID=2486360 RepID=UPI00219570DF|nr:RTM1 protein [Exophiala viscosa]